MQLLNTFGNEKNSSFSRVMLHVTLHSREFEPNFKKKINALEWSYYYATVKYYILYCVIIK
jgi:hypothetical protein